MTQQRLDSRQSEHRAVLDQLTGPTDTYPLSTILPAINSELTPVFALKEQNPATLIVDVGAGKVQNPTSLRYHTGISGEEKVAGTVTFPSTVPNDITFSDSANVVTITATDLPAANFNKCMICLDTGTGNYTAVLGVPNTTIATAELPESPKNTIPIGYIVLENVGGVVQNIEAEDVHQFGSGAGAGGAGGLSSVTAIRDGVEDVTGHVNGDRFVVAKNSGTLHASWGVIAGLADGDIVVSDGAVFSIDTDISEEENSGDGLTVYNMELDKIHSFNGTDWVRNDRELYPEELERIYGEDLLYSDFTLTGTPTLSLDTAGAFKSKKIIKFVPTAATDAISLQRAIGEVGHDKAVGISFMYKTIAGVADTVDGDWHFEVVQVGGADDGVTLVEGDLNSDGVVNTWGNVFQYPADATDVRLVFEHNNADLTQELHVDAISLTRELHKIMIVQGESEEYLIKGALTNGTTATRCVYFSTINNEVSTINNCGTIVNDPADGWSFTASKRCVITGSIEQIDGGSDYALAVVKNMTAAEKNIILETNLDNTAIEFFEKIVFMFRDAGNNAEASVSAGGSRILEAGDVIHINGENNYWYGGDNRGAPKLIFTVTPEEYPAIVVPSADQLFGDENIQNGINITATTTNPTKHTTRQTDQIRWHREGRYLCATYSYHADSQAGGASGNGDYLIELPTGLEIDDNYVGFYTEIEGNTATQFNGSHIIGYGRLGNAAETANLHVHAVPYDSTHFRLFGMDVTNYRTYAGNGWHMFDCVDWSCTIKVPIKGWSNVNSPLLAVPYGVTKWQLKTLAADAANGAGITFNNLEIGKTYRISGQCMYIQGAVSTVDAAIFHNGNKIAIFQYGNGSGVGVTPILPITPTIFTATATTVALLNDNTVLMRGNGTQEETFAILEQLPLHEQTNQW